MKFLAPLALAALLAAPAAEAAVVTFDADPSNTQGAGSYTSGGLTFTDNGTYQYLGIWGGGSPGANGTNGLIFADFGAGGTVTVTRTGGGLFDLASLDMVLSWYAARPSGTVTINGTPYVLTGALSTLAVNLSGVSSVVISDLAPGSGYWLADNVTWQVAAVPLPAGGLLLLAALGGLGLAVRRRRG